jgi:hypothetical protein
MGQAFHRKRISIDRSRTSGIGFKYVNVIPHVRELTPEQVVAREQKAQQQAALDEQRRVQKENIAAAVSFTGNLLQAWKEWVDYHDQRLVDFAGWTTSNYCALPVEEDVADFYHDQIEWHQRQADRSLSLDELDGIVKVFCKRKVSTAQIVEEATKAIRYVAQECTDFEGTDLAGFAGMLSRRAARAKQTNTDLAEALAFVSVQIFERLKEKEQESSI